MRDGWVSARRPEPAAFWKTATIPELGTARKETFLLLLAAPSAGNSPLILHLLPITGTNKSGKGTGIPFRPDGQEVVH